MRISARVIVPLAVLLLLAMVPATPAPAWTPGVPVTIDRSRLKLTGGTRSLTLTIQQGLVFKGTLAKEAMTEDELADLIAQVAASLGMSVDDFCADFDKLSEAVNKMNENGRMTPEKMQQLKDDLFALASVAPGLVGQAAGIAQKWDQMSDHRYSDSLDSASSSGVTDKVGDFTKDSPLEQAGDVATQVAAWPAALKATYDRFQREVQEWKDMQAGLDAMRGLAKLYDLINRRINEALLKSNKPWKITFDHVKASEPFTLFGVQGKQTWTLSAWIGQTVPAEAGNWKGKYWDVFSIDVDYALAGWCDQLPEAIFQMGWAGDLLTAYETGLPTHWDVRTSKVGKCSAKRELGGYVTVMVDATMAAGATATISFDVKHNDKTVALSGYTVEARGPLITQPAIQFDTGFDVAADKDNFKLTWKGIGINFDLPGAGYYKPLGPTSGPIPWSGDIWRDSDQPAGKLTIGL